MARDYKAEYARRQQTAKSKGFKSYAEERKIKANTKAQKLGFKTKRDQDKAVKRAAESKGFKALLKQSGAVKGDDYLRVVAAWNDATTVAGMHRFLSELDRYIEDHDWTDVPEYLFWRDFYA